MHAFFKRPSLVVSSRASGSLHVLSGGVCEAKKKHVHCFIVASFSIILWQKNNWGDGASYHMSTDLVHSAQRSPRQTASSLQWGICTFRREQKNLCQRHIFEQINIL